MITFFKNAMFTRFVFCFLLLQLVPISTMANEKEVINGVVTFNCDLKEEYLESSGIKFIKQVPHGEFVTNMFGAYGTKITVRNSDEKIVGMGKADPNGKFAIEVKPDDFYQLDVTFHSLSLEEAISREDSQDLVIDFGRVSSDTIKIWLE